LRSAHAGLIWCPSSNLFLFENVVLRGDSGFPKSSSRKRKFTIDWAGRFSGRSSLRIAVSAHAFGRSISYVTHQAAAASQSKRWRRAVPCWWRADLVAVRETGQLRQKLWSGCPIEICGAGPVGGARTVGFRREYGTVFRVSCADGLQPLRLRSVLWNSSSARRLFLSRP